MSHIRGAQRFLSFLKKPAALEGSYSMGVTLAPLAPYLISSAGLGVRFCPFSTPKELADDADDRLKW